MSPREPDAVDRTLPPLDDLARRWLDVPDCRSRVTEVLSVDGAIAALEALSDGFQTAEAVDRATRRSIRDIRRDALAEVPETGSDDRTSRLEFYACAAQARTDWKTLLGDELDAANVAANFASIVLYCGPLRPS